VVAAVLVNGMPFEGWTRAAERPWSERLAGLTIVTALTAILYGLLTALAHDAHWTRATPEEWIACAGLNALGASVILHVAIGRRWRSPTPTRRLRINPGPAGHERNVVVTGPPSALSAGVSFMT
jgi:hypothetical protein